MSIAPLALLLQQWASKYDYELDIETASKFCTPQLQGATNNLISTRLEKIQRLDLPQTIPKTNPPVVKNVLKLFEMEDARADVKQTEERLIIVKENIKMLQRYISTARNTVYKPIPSKFMPTANDLVVDEISSHGLTPIAAGVTGASRHLKNLRKFHVLSHARALKNVAMLDELKIANIKSEGNNLLNVRNYLQKHVNNLVQVRISLQSELEGKPTIPDLFNDVKEHIILLAQAQEQLREMHKTFFSKVKEAHANFEDTVKITMMRKPAQKSLENLYYNLDNLFKKFDILHCHHTAKKLDEADWIWHNDITIRELKLIVGVAPETTFQEFCKLQTEHNNTQATLGPLYISLQEKFSETKDSDNSAEILLAMKNDRVVKQEYYANILLPTLEKCINDLNRIELIKETVKKKVHARNWYFNNTEKLVSLFDRLETV